MAARVLERESQLAALRSYATEASAGEGRLILVAGEAGIGKSTLVEELEATLPELSWWWGACDGLSTPRPLAPLSDIARQAGGPLRSACESGAARDALFDALLQALQEGPQLRVIVIEDVHWADEATLDMLRFLGRRIRTAPALLVVTYRDDALGPDEPLRVTLGDLSTHRTTRRVVLGPLSETAVRELAGDSEIEPGELYRLTGGVPFFVAEVLAAGPTGISGSARDAVLARAAGVGPDARRVLDYAALIGSRTSVSLLQAASGATEQALDDLVAGGILVGDGDALRFRHEIARQTISAQIPAHRAVHLHRAILDALLAAGVDDDALLAFHADVAGDASVVLEHAPRAARRCAAVASHRAAAEQLERAIRHVGGAEPARRAQLLDEYADELALVERWDDTASARRSAIELWRAAGEALREGASETKLGSAMWRLCRGEESIAALRRARELLEPLGPSEELGYLYASGADSEDPDLVAAYIARSAEIAADLDVPALRVSALNGLGYIAACRLGDYETPLLEALSIARRHGLPQQVARSFANLTEYYASDFRLTEAEPLFLEGVAYCDEHDVSTYGNCVRGHYALALLDQGRWDEALQQARDVLSTRASPINRLTSLVTAGLVNARRGLPSEYLAEAEAVATGVDEAPYIAMARLAQTEAAWLGDDPDAARTHLAVARSRLTELEVKELAAVIAWERRLGAPTTETPVVAAYAAQVAGPPRRAAAVWDELRMPYHAALALGDSDDADDLREALRRLDPVSPPAARIVRRRMREHGLRTIPSGVRASTRADPHGLTRREREVLDLVRAGLTNEQIGARLVISVKTVDHHVSAVLAKLGVGSRREAIAVS